MLDNVHTQRHRWTIIQPEPGYWMLAVGRGDGIDAYIGCTQRGDSLIRVYIYAFFRKLHLVGMYAQCEMIDFAWR